MQITIDDINKLIEQLQKCKAPKNPLVWYEGKMYRANDFAKIWKAKNKKKS